MKIEHMRWQGSGWEPTVPGRLHAAQLVLLFGCPALLKQRDLLQGIQQAYPHPRVRLVALPANGSSACLLSRAAGELVSIGASLLRKHAPGQSPWGR